MGLQQPLRQFFKTYKAILPAVKEVAEESMLNAVNEAVIENNEAEIDTDLAVSVDGSWQKRGHKSLNGIVSVISVDTGKVLDVQCLSKFCHGCLKVEPCDTEAVIKHRSVCLKNHIGSSGAMEAEGLKQIFKRSKEKYGVRYTTYLGDGDSSSFLKVQECKLYGEECEISKWECVGHVQKRMGSRLRKLKNEHKGKKLIDGKTFGGRNRLTDVQINSFQLYYGMAIRNNRGNCA